MPFIESIELAVSDFFRSVSISEIEIYNEFSLQHEIGCFLRQRLGPERFRVQFERPVEFFKFRSADFLKREIDIVVTDNSSGFRVAIELKFPRNGQYPEQMFKACEDIAFLEQIVFSGFNAGFFVMAADDRLFYHGPGETGIYAYFRSGQPLTGNVTKPTGRRDYSINIGGRYVLDWKIAGDYRYLCARIEAIKKLNTATAGSSM